MIQRFFLDRVDGEAGRCAITKRIELAADVLPNVTEAGLALAHAAITRAERAENLSVGFGMPPEGFFHTENIPSLCYSSAHEPNGGIKRHASYRAEGAQRGPFKNILPGYPWNGCGLGAR